MLGAARSLPHSLHVDSTHAPTTHPLTHPSIHPQVQGVPRHHPQRRHRADVRRDGVPPPRALPLHPGEARATPDGLGVVDGWAVRRRLWRGRLRIVGAMDDVQQLVLRMRRSAVRVSRQAAESGVTTNNPIAHPAPPPPNRRSSRPRPCPPPPASAPTPCSSTTPRSSSPSPTTPCAPAARSTRPCTRPTAPTSPCSERLSNVQLLACRRAGGGAVAASWWMVC